MLDRRPGWTLLSALTAASLFAAAATAQEPEADPAVAAIQKAGGKVERDDKAEGKPIVVVNLATTGAGDDELAAVKGMNTLHKLTLNNTKITDAGLAHLEGLEGLERLYLVDTGIGDAGLDHLKGLKNLHVLSLVGTKVTDAGLAQLKGLAGLKQLFLAATPVTDEGVKSLQEALPELKIER